MMTKTNEEEAAKAFTKQAPIFDDLYSTNPIIEYKRERVRNNLLQYLPKQSSILELNSGTGEDAVFFGSHGHSVHATDISDGMQNVLRKKIEKYRLADKVGYELCSFTELHKLRNKGPYDAIFFKLCRAELY